MRKYLSAIGRPTFVVIITLIALIMAVLLTVLISLIQEIPIESDDITRAIVIPIIIAPVISWYLVGLLLRLDELEEKLHGLVNYDELTGLMSRRAFFEGAEKAVILASRHQHPLCLLVLDLDHFKAINDRYGHIAGDAVLTSFGQLISNIIRQSDFAGRIGGEEFCFVLPHTELAQARFFAAKIHKCLSEEPLNFKNNNIHYTASIGICELDGKSIKTLEQLMHQADQALYKAKDSGRNQTLCYEV